MRQGGKKQYSGASAGCDVKCRHSFVVCSKSRSAAPDGLGCYIKQRHAPRGAKRCTTQRRTGCLGNKKTTGVPTPDTRKSSTTRNRTRDPGVDHWAFCRSATVARCGAESSYWCASGCRLKWNILCVCSWVWVQFLPRSALLRSGVFTPTPPSPCSPLTYSRLQPILVRGDGPEPCVRST